MISFRYHVVSTVAILLALATGILVGSTALQNDIVGSVDASLHRVDAANRALDRQLATAHAQLDQAREFDAALTPLVVSGRLAGRSVVVVTTPGAPASRAAALVTALEAAGASAITRVAVQRTMFDPQQSAFLAALVARLPHRAGTGSGDAFGVLASALGRPGGPGAQTVLASYLDAHLVTVTGPSGAQAGQLAQPAQLAVVVLPAARVLADQSTARSTRQLVDALDASTEGAVVAAAEPGAIRTLRAVAATPARWSSVAGVDTADGLIATVLALADRAAGGSGAYGAASASPVP